MGVARDAADGERRMTLHLFVYNLRALSRGAREALIELTLCLYELIPAHIRQHRFCCFLFAVAFVFVFSRLRARYHLARD